MFKNYSNYEVYSDGRIWSYKTNKFLKPQTNNKGYKQVGLSDNEGNRKMYLLHRVVYEAVTSSPIPQGYEINHIDERKDNNAISNLELVSHKENCNYGTIKDRISKKMKGIIPKANPQKQVGAFKNGELVIVFQSIAEAGRNGFNIGTISMCCNGKRKTHNGFEWRFI